jgi:hypothetical protein
MYRILDFEEILFVAMETGPVAVETPGGDLKWV